MPFLTIEASNSANQAQWQREFDWVRGLSPRYAAIEQALYNEGGIRRIVIEEVQGLMNGSPADVSVDGDTIRIRITLDYAALQSYTDASGQTATFITPTGLIAAHEVVHALFSIAPFPGIDPTDKDAEEEYVRGVENEIRTQLDATWPMRDVSINASDIRIVNSDLHHDRETFGLLNIPFEFTPLRWLNPVPSEPSNDGISIIQQLLPDGTIRIHFHDNSGTRDWTDGNCSPLCGGVTQVWWIERGAAG